MISFGVWLTRYLEKIIGKKYMQKMSALGFRTSICILVNKFHKHYGAFTILDTQKGENNIVIDLCYENI